MLLCTELSVLLFGICFGKFVRQAMDHSFDRSVDAGRVHAKRQSVQTMKILIISFLFASIYTAIEVGVFKSCVRHLPLSLKAVLEFRDDTRPIQLNTSNYNLYSYGGMKFLLISSSMFLLVLSHRSSKAKPFVCVP